MKKNTLIIVLAIIALVLIAYASYSSLQTKKQISQVMNLPANPPVAENTSNQENNPQNSTNIHVFSPLVGDTISSPVKITGEVRVFENQFNIRVLDGNGKILVEDIAMGNVGDVNEFKAFEKDVVFPTATTPNGTIEVFDYSAKDGSEIDKVTIPVKFSNVY